MVACIGVFRLPGLEVFGTAWESFPYRDELKHQMRSANFRSQTFRSIWRSHRGESRWMHVYSFIKCHGPVEKIDDWKHDYETSVSYYVGIMEMSCEKGYICLKKTKTFFFFLSLRFRNYEDSAFMYI